MAEVPSLGMIVSEGGGRGREPSNPLAGRDPKLHPPTPLLMHEPSRGGGLPEFPHFMSPNSCRPAAHNLFKRYGEHFGIEA